MVAIFSAAMSSVSSGINSLSAASVEDFFNRKNTLSDDQYMTYSKYAVVFWGVVCIVLAFFTGDIAKTVIEAINKVGSVFYGPILATFISAIAIKRVHAMGANIGLIAGVLVNVYLWLFVPSVFWFWWNAVGAVVTLLVGVASSLVIKKQGTSEEDHTMQFQWIVDKPKAVILLAFFVFIIAVSVAMPKLF